MHSSSITLLFLIPVGFILLAIIMMFLGRYTLNPGYFRKSFILQFAGFLVAFFVNLIMHGNHVVVKAESFDFDIVLKVSIFAMALISMVGFLYMYYNNFLPQLFTRASMFFSLTSLLICGFASLNKEVSEVEQKNNVNSRFKPANGSVEKQQSVIRIIRSRN